MTPIQTPEDKLDEILNKVAEEGRGWVHDQLDGTSLFKDKLDQIDKTVAQSKQALLKWRDEEVEKAKIAQWQELVRAVRQAQNNGASSIKVEGLIRLATEEIQAITTHQNEEKEKL